MNKHKYGFTIVELLIVIVVIGILAAITIVAYNGVQDRARTARTISLANNYIKALKFWQAEKGEFPKEASCIGPAATFAPSRTCFAQGWTGNAPYSSSFNTTLSTYLGGQGGIGDYGNTDDSNDVKGAMWYYKYEASYPRTWYGGDGVVFGYTLGPKTDCGLPNVLSQPYGTITPSGAAYTERTTSYTYCLIYLATETS